MDIQGSDNVARTRWQPANGALGASRVSGSTFASQSTDDAEGISSTPTGAASQSQGLTGTGNNLLDMPLTMEPATPESVAADARKLGDDLRMTLAMAGIKSDPPLAFDIDDTGTVKVHADDPRAAAVNDVLSREPDLQNRLLKLVGDAQWVEHGEAVAGYYSQVNAGADAAAASKRLVAASQQISGATGFTLEADGKLSLQCAGMGQQLMPPELAQVSDEERMWREMMRLTDRTRRTGVVAAAEDAEAAEKKDRDRREGAGGPSAGQPDLVQAGTGVSGTGAAKAAA